MTEISFDVELGACITLDLEPGTLITEELLHDAINAMNRTLEDGPTYGGDGSRLYVSLVGRAIGKPVSAYDSDTGAEWRVEVGQPLPEAKPIFAVADGDTVGVAASFTDAAYLAAGQYPGKAYRLTLGARSLLIAADTGDQAAVMFRAVMKREGLPSVGPIQSEEVSP